MSRTCINSNCAKNIPDDSLYCGFCRTKQDIDRKDSNDPSIEAAKMGAQPQMGMDEDFLVFFADDFETIRQFDPVITPTKDQVSFENLLDIFTEAVKNKNYPFSVESIQQRWRAECGKGKQRIVIYPTHDPKWEKILFSIAVEQLGNDTTIKLSVLRKNEMAAFYFSTLESIGAFSTQESISIPIEYKINWNDEKKYRPSVEQGIRYFNNKNEEILSQFTLDEINKSHNIPDSLKQFLGELFKQPIAKSYLRNLIEQTEKKQALAKEIEENEDTKLAEASQDIVKCSKQISAKEQSKLDFQKSKGITILSSFVLSIPFAFITKSMYPVLIGPAVWFIIFLIQISMKSGIESLNFHLKELYDVQNQIHAQKTKKNGEINRIQNDLNAKRDELIHSIEQMKWSEFRDAEQNEIKWRTPSFVDEELEQLISLVKNLSNEITNKITKKKEGKGLQLQTAMGLGGMGFDD